ncbi:hypothetical protein F2Q70_00040185 [Brassica cretica]|uniref:Partial AB-hydrolase lipase domain-containing protein n=1 Tax=Brassica cretica TaxID=69181 RepID=A0A8S9K5N1_BRACR|nr:hypothetical protein F2Q70_00040185 [Brassica cretica]
MGLHASAFSLQAGNHLWRMAPIQSSDKAFGDRRRKRSKKKSFSRKEKDSDAGTDAHAPAIRRIRSQISFLSLPNLLPITVCFKMVLKVSPRVRSSVRGFELFYSLDNTRAPFRLTPRLHSAPSRVQTLRRAVRQPYEVSAIVVDLGSHTCKAGYAGEDAPKAVFPSVVGAVDGVEAMDVDVDSAKTNSNSEDSKSEKEKGKRKLCVGSQALNYRRDHMEILSPIKDGIVSDWDLVDNIWEHAFRSCLMIDPKEHPMLLAEPPLNTQQQREKAAELMFEKYKVPALFMAKNPVLTSFATGRATSLVVDCGGGSTTISPVHEGYVLQKAVVSNPVGGEFLTDCLLKSLESKGIKIRPRYSFKRKEVRPGEFQVEDVGLPDTTESYKLFCQRMIVGDIKDSICRVPDTPYDDKSYSNIPTTSYELPDGQTLEIGADKFKIPDVMFNPSIVQTIPGTEKYAEMIPSVRGLPHMVMESINKCDVDIRRELYSSILLAGGTSSMQQLKERLEKDLIEESPHSARVKVLASGNTTERRFSGVSSFNRFIHELSLDSDTSSLEYSSLEDDEEEDSDGISTPPSPLSQTSLRSWASLPEYYESHWTDWITQDSPMSPRRRYRRSSRPIPGKEHHVPIRTTDRRRGVIEDLQLGTEIFIEAVFDFFHKAAHLLLSPSEAFGIILSWFSSEGDYDDDFSDDELVQTYTLGDTDSSLTERTITSLYNTDTRTCQDVITELGYPYEAIRVVTSDGYGLLLERIPRRDARRALYLQHGALDSSMGWVSNGVVGSPAFAAYDQGYDVYLGNFRGLVSRDHVNKNISSKDFWSYSINEHAREDIPAIIEKIHEIKTSELRLYQPNVEEVEQPYKLCLLSHSLGCAAVLMYVITRRIEEKPHRLSRLILLSPAGFHEDSNLFFTLIEHSFLLLGPVLSRIFPAFYIPTRFFRMLFNKLARDFHNYPAVGGLVQTLMGYVVGGDSSNWVGVIGLPHYNMDDMPAVSFRVALHLTQIKRTRKFRMFDYGGVGANMEVYGSPEPLDLGEFYGLIDVPVDLVAGKKDRVIRPSMVRKHYRVMIESGVADVSYSEFEYAHLDFTFSHREELLAYVMSRLLLVEPAKTQPVRKKGMKLKKKVETAKTKK